MKSKKRSGSLRAQALAATPVAASGSHVWYYVLGIAAAIFAAFEIYGPAIHGPFLLDDRYLPFFLPAWADAPLRNWIAGVRPLLMFTFWANYQIGRTDPQSYHVFNVVIHICNAILIWRIVERILEWAGVGQARRRMLAVFAGIVFLVHPLNTESVAYIASRSEGLSVLFFNGALALFVYRRRVAATWRIAAGVLILFLSASLTKEHAAVLPLLLLLTDYFWNPGFSFDGIRRNWRLYVPFVAAILIAGWWVARVLSSAATAGFGMKDLRWYEYFFSQGRAIWLYIRMFALPFGQNADREFAISRTVMDHGALFGLLALAVASAAAWKYRRNFPLAGYGWFAFLILLAPTSSFVPVRDLVAERRLYLPFIGLLLISCEFLRRLRLSRPALVSAMACVTAAFAFAAYQRNELWGDATAFWKDAAEKSPHKSRPAFQLAYAYYSEGRCAEAASEYEKASRMEKPDYSLYVDWGLALDCAGKPDAAIEQLKHALAVENTAHAWATLAKVYAQQKRLPEALAALDGAEKADPSFEYTYVYRGNVYIMTNDFARAIEQFQRALALNPSDTAARDGLAMAQRQQPPRM